MLGLAQVHAATTERIVTDRNTGLAISGFDPVAYFTDAVPRAGLPDHELASSGVTWRFRNEGNMAAFAADPETYSPQFGGYDPVGIARGVATAGHPQLWLIHDKRLYLFQTAETRERFTADPDAVRAVAEEKWPDVERGLVP
ncbi:MAG: YHS domain-containing (seleno)protein [Pseudorhodoplanes sp.]